MNSEEKDINFKGLFYPLTTSKAIHLIIFLGLIVYIYVLFNGFVWDDLVYIVNNSDVRTLDLAYLFSQNSWNSGLFYRPLTAVYFSIMYAFFGTNAFFYHLVQVTLHIVNAILLFLLLKKLLNKQIVAFFLSLIFLVHPIQVESVAFVAGSLSPLALFFGMLALILDFKDNISYRRLVLISVLLMTALLIRETGILFFAFILLYRFLFKSRKAALQFIGIATGLAVIYIFFRFAVGEVALKATRVDIVPIAGLSLYERLVNIPAVIFYYLYTFVYPQTLVIDQQWIIKALTFKNFYLPLLVLFILTLGLVFIGKYLHKANKHLFRVFLFFLAWFLLGLAFHMQLFPLDMTVADRFFYFPFVGLLGIWGTIFCLLPQVKRYRQAVKYLVAAVCIILLLLSIRTFIRTTNWHDEITLFSHDSQIYNNWSIENNLGSAYANIKENDNALPHFIKSAELHPTELNVHNIAYIYDKKGDLRKAQQYYEKSLTLNQYPSYEHVVIDKTTAIRLARVYLLLNENTKSKKLLNDKTKEYPNEGELWLYLAISESRLRNENDAVAALNEAKKYLQSTAAEAFYEQYKNGTPSTNNASKNN